ncbi:hypothetical protein R1sor_022988 [Riccia sorocarpa]|uniref:Uncharacterized protein n=1 Tax=Riccia sorocarpa TaxID=122646 RepID=A0ABD3GPF2_9MARC
MACCFMTGELPSELRILGHDVPDTVIVSCLSQLQLSGYEKPSSLVTSRAANDRSSPVSCVRAGKFTRHEHGPPVPGDRDFRQGSDCIFSSCTLATEIQGLKKMLRVMGETKDELIGSPGPVKRRNALVEEDGDAGKLFSEWRLVGRTLRPIDNNVVSAFAQNAKGDNQFFEPLVYPVANENAKGDNQFFEPLVPFSTHEHAEPTKPLLVSDSIRPSVNHANMKKIHDSETEVSTFLNEHPGAVGDSGKPASDVSQTANEVAETGKSMSRKLEVKARKLDGCQEPDATRLLVDGVTSQAKSPERKEVRKFIEKKVVGSEAVGSKGGSDQSEEEDTTSSAASITSSDTLTTEEEDNASGGQGRGKRSSAEYLREERIRKAAIEAGVSYYHDGVVYRENIVYDMIRSPSSGTQEDMLDSNHDLEEYPKTAPRKKSYNPELLSLSNDHFLEAFEKTLAELDPMDTIEQETFASVTRQQSKTEPEQFHQFNFASLSSLVSFRLEDENLLTFSSPPVPATVSTTTEAVPDQPSADPHVTLGDSSSILSDNSKEVNQFRLDEETLPESGEKPNQFSLEEGNSLHENRDEVTEVLDEHSLESDSSFTNSVVVPSTPDHGAEMNPPPRKEHSATPPRGLVVDQVETRDETNNVVTSSAPESSAEAAGVGEEVSAAPSTPSTGNSDAAVSEIPADVVVSPSNLQGTANTYENELMRRRPAVVESESGVRSSADRHPSIDQNSNLSPNDFNDREHNESRSAAGELDRGISDHLEPLTDLSNFATTDADDQSQRPRSKTIKDFFTASEMTLRRPSTIEIKKRDKETRSLLRAVEQKAIAEAAPIDHLRFALPPPSARGSSRRHSLSERSLEFAGLALTPIKVPTRDRAPVQGTLDQKHGSGPQGPQGAPKRRGESSRTSGLSGSKSPQVESSPGQRRNGDPLGVGGSPSPYGKTQSGYLKKGGGGIPSPSSSVASSRTPHTPQSTTSSGSEISPKQNPFKRSPGIYSSPVQREKRSADIPASVLLNTSRMSTSVNFGRMSTSVNLPSAGERLSNSRQTSTRSTTESLKPPGGQKKSPVQDVRKAPDRTTSRPAFSTSTAVPKSRTVPSTTTAAKEKLTGRRTPVSNLLIYEQQQPTLRSTDPYSLALSVCMQPSEDLCKISTG